MYRGEDSTAGFHVQCSELNLSGERPINSARQHRSPYFLGTPRTGHSFWIFQVVGVLGFRGFYRALWVSNVFSSSFGLRLGALDDFRPDLVLYDAGVDIHVDDDLGNLLLAKHWGRFASVVGGAACPLIRSARLEVQMSRFGCRRSWGVRVPSQGKTHDSVRQTE